MAIVKRLPKIKTPTAVTKVSNASWSDLLEWTATLAWNLAYYSLAAVGVLLTATVVGVGKGSKLAWRHGKPHAARALRWTGSAVRTKVERRKKDSGPELSQAKPATQIPVPESVSTGKAPTIPDPVSPRTTPAPSVTTTVSGSDSSTTQG